jgi:hypothetical protein
MHGIFKIIIPKDDEITERIMYLYIAIEQVDHYNLWYCEWVVPTYFEQQNLQLTYDFFQIMFLMIWI